MVARVLAASLAAEALYAALTCQRRNLWNHPYGLDNLVNVERDAMVSENKEKDIITLANQQANEFPGNLKIKQQATTPPSVFASLIQ